jgi:hypothetical protein
VSGAAMEKPNGHPYSSRSHGCVLHRILNLYGLEPEMKNLVIDNKYIASLNPCDSRHNNYLTHYKNTSFSIVEFLKLEHITYDDKIWVWKRFAQKEEIIRFGLACADSVLDIFEESYPEDKRPRQALDATLAYLINPTEENKQACRDAAHVADAAAYAAYAADAAAYAAHAAARNTAREDQQNLNLCFLIDIYTGDDE